MSESSDSGALSESAMQNELESFDYEIEQINSQLKEAKKQYREIKRLTGKIDRESVEQICHCEIDLKLIERKKKFMEEKKITREMLEKMSEMNNNDYKIYVFEYIVQFYVDLAKSVVSDKEAGKNIENHDFYKEKFFFEKFSRFYGWSSKCRCGLGQQFELLPKEIFSLASKEQMENTISINKILHGVSLIDFGDKLKYLSKEQLEEIYSYGKSFNGDNPFKKVAKSNIDFPPDSPIYEFLNDRIPQMEGGGCCLLL